MVPTLNSRQQLSLCLDSLQENASEAETIVVNGPSTDGTSGLVRDHDGADILIEVAERNINVARNAGISESSGDIIALVGQDTMIENEWYSTVINNFANSKHIITGPVHREVTGGMTTETAEMNSIQGQQVTYFDGGNVIFRRSVLETLDGFDEYLNTGGARDVAHRLANLSYHVSWQPDVSVLRRDVNDIEDRTAQNSNSSKIGLKYRSLAYRLVKNYGLRPTIIGRILRHAGVDAIDSLKDIGTDGYTPALWFSNGRDVIKNIFRGSKDATIARKQDQSPRRNPNGVSSRTDRIVAKYRD
ncbi:MAG: glycosyltransferase family 2 protein [Halobacteriaceae archaeon]